MGGRYIASDDGVLELKIALPNGGHRKVRLDGFDPGEEIYVAVTEGRPR